jgi:hypothetical protein
MQCPVSEHVDLFLHSSLHFRGEVLNSETQFALMFVAVWRGSLESLYDLAIDFTSNVRKCK